MDNGATLILYKTQMGLIPGTAQTSDAGPVAVGHEDAALEYKQTHLAALKLTDSNGRSWPYLGRGAYAPNSICSIFSEPVWVKRHGAAFTHDTTSGRVMWLPPGKEAPVKANLFRSSEHESLICGQRGRDATDKYASDVLGMATGAQGAAPTAKRAK